MLSHYILCKTQQNHMPFHVFRWNHTIDCSACLNAYKCQPIVLRHQIRPMPRRSHELKPLIPSSIQPSRVLTLTCPSPHVTQPSREGSPHVSQQSSHPGVHKPGNRTLQQSSRAPSQQLIHRPTDFPVHRTPQRSIDRPIHKLIVRLTDKMID